MTERIVRREKTWRRRLEALFAGLRRVVRRIDARVVWDSVMVYLAFLNVGLIVFDLTYLWLRPLYVNWTPIVARIYDEHVKGIEPHPLTTSYLASAERLAETLAAEPPLSQADLLDRLTELRRLSQRLYDENPFERSGQSLLLARLEARVRRHLAAGGDAVVPASGRGALVSYWSAGQGDLPARLQFFERQLAPLLELAYERRHDYGGGLYDRFWLLDLPFLLIFASEFFVRWILAVRRRLYPKWFLFPIFNWYDVLGIIPVKELRFFRLFRVASIYVRLYRSERTGVGADPLSRTAKYFANIINEEISDMVSLRILNETQEEILAGTHRRIIRAVAAPRRDAVAREIVARTRQVLLDLAVRQRLRGFLDLNLERAVESGGVLKRIPLPGAVVRPVVDAVGHVIFDALMETLTATLETDEGRQALEELVAASIDGLVEDLTAGEVEELTREIALEALEHVKEAVRVRKWVDADTPIRLGGDGGSGS